MLRFRVMGACSSFSSSLFLFWVLRFHVVLPFVFEFVLPVLCASFKFGSLHFVFEFWTVPALFHGTKTKHVN